VSLQSVQSVSSSRLKKLSDDTPTPPHPPPRRIKINKKVKVRYLEKQRELAGVSRPARQWNDLLLLLNILNQIIYILGFSPVTNFTFHD